LSMEEDGEDASNSSAEVWDESFEAPFWQLQGHH
jgi:serine/threonine-protein phosphatase 2A regulatory subunit B''